MNSRLFFDIASRSPFMVVSSESTGATGTGASDASFDAVLASLLDKAESVSTGSTDDVAQSLASVVVTQTSTLDSIPLPKSLTVPELPETLQSVPANLIIRDNGGHWFDIPVIAEIDPGEGEPAALTLVIPIESTGSVTEIERVKADIPESDIALVFGEDVRELLSQDWEDVPEIAQIPISGSASELIQAFSAHPVSPPSPGNSPEIVLPQAVESIPVETASHDSQAEHMPDVPVAEPATPIPSSETAMTRPAEPVHSDSRHQSPDQPTIQSGPDYDVPPPEVPNRPDHSPEPVSATVHAGTRSSATQPPQPAASVNVQTATVQVLAKKTPSRQPVQSKQVINVTNKAPSVPTTAAPEPVEPSPDIRISNVQVFLHDGYSKPAETELSIRRLSQTVTVHIVADEPSAPRTPESILRPEPTDPQAEQQGQEARNQVDDGTVLTMRDVTRSKGTAANQHTSETVTKPLAASRPALTAEAGESPHTESGSEPVKPVPPAADMVGQADETAETVSYRQMKPAISGPEIAVNDATVPPAPEKTDAPLADNGNEAPVPSDTSVRMGQTGPKAHAQELRQTPEVNRAVVKETTMPSAEPAIPPQTDLPAIDTAGQSDGTMRQTSDVAAAQPEQPANEMRIAYHQRPKQTPAQVIPRQVVVDDAEISPVHNVRTVTTDDATPVVTTRTDAGLPINLTGSDQGAAGDEHHVVSNGLPVRSVFRESAEATTVTGSEIPEQPTLAAAETTDRSIRSIGMASRPIESESVSLQQPSVKEDSGMTGTPIKSPSTGDQAAKAQAVAEQASPFQAAPVVAQAETRRHERQDSRFGSTTTGTLESTTPMETIPAVHRPMAVVGDREPSFGETFGDDESFAPHIGIDSETFELTGDFSTPFSAALQSTDDTGLDIDTTSLRQPVSGRTISANPAEINGSIVRHAVVMMKQGVSSAEIRLDPPSLGKLKLEIVTENGKITGRITVETTEVRDLMQQNLTQLRENMAQSGLKVESFDVQVGHNDGTDSWARKETLRQLMRTGNSSGRALNDQTLTAGPVMHTRQTVSLNTQLFDRWI